jgi:hypothetical protein
MSYKNLPALRRALGRAGLADAAQVPDCLVRVEAVGGRLHNTWCEHARRSGEQTTIALAELFERADICPDCESRITAGSGASTQLDFVLGLLEASEVARSAVRFAADPAKSTVVGKAATLASKIKSHLGSIDSLLGRVYPAAIVDAARQVQESLREAADALANVGRNPALRAKVAARVAAELVPTRLQAGIKLESTPVLVGITPHNYTGKKVQEVLDAFAITPIGGHGSTIVLLCPRYVVDYINRHYADGSSWSSLVMTAPAQDLTDVQIAAAVAIWDPYSSGPLTNLSVAIDAAVMATASAG